MVCMRLLVLGGTRFVGWAIAAAAVGNGWQVTTFNRGVSGADIPEVRALRGDRTRADDVARLADVGPWDAVVDTSGYVPRETLAVCERLEPRRPGRFLPTVSVDLAGRRAAVGTLGGAVLPAGCRA